MLLHHKQECWCGLGMWSVVGVEKGEESEDASLLSGLGHFSEKAMAPTPVLLPGKSHGQRSLVGFSPWGH